jgi:alpha-beta hydrolase superfamily lysophospholipase
MKRTKVAKTAGVVFCLGLVGLNAVAYRQARAFTHFASRGPRTKLGQLSFAGSVRLLVEGARVPRPENRRTPSGLGLAYERHVFTGGRGIPLEAWLIPHRDAHGTVVLFHGHAASKDSQLEEAEAFHEMGFNALLVDFYGSGGSGGNGTTIGYYEALDVTRAFAYAKDLPSPGPVVLFGGSMGAAAVLKAVADDDLAPAALVLECPFDSLIGTVRHRFTNRAVPSFPLADLLVFWGGVQQGFNAFAFRPVDLAARVRVPTLLMNGDQDEWVSVGEARAIFEAVRAPKTLHYFAGVGHDSCFRNRPDEWREVVGAFLEERIGEATRK